MTKQHEQETANQAYSRIAKDIQDKIAQLQVALEEHAKEQKADPFNWGNVGDIAQISRMLEEGAESFIRHNGKPKPAEQPKAMSKTKAPKEKALTVPLYEAPSRERNEDKYGHQPGNQCICCMKPMAPGECLHVHMNTDWVAVDPDRVTEENCEELTGAGSQGAFAIGNECAKKMKGYTFLLKPIEYIHETPNQ